MNAVQPQREGKQGQRPPLKRRKAKRRDGTGKEDEQGRGKAHAADIVRFAGAGKRFALAETWCGGLPRGFRGNAPSSKAFCDYLCSKVKDPA